MAKKTNLIYVLGEDWTIPFTMRDGAGVVIDLTPMTAIEFRVAGITASLGNGVTRDGGAGGTGTVQITPAMQADLPPGDYSYRLQATLASGAKTAQNYGNVRAVNP